MGRPSSGLKQYMTTRITKAIVGKEPYLHDNFPRTYEVNVLIRDSLRKNRVKRKYTPSRHLPTDTGYIKYNSFEEIPEETAATKK